MGDVSGESRRPVICEGFRETGYQRVVWEDYRAAFLAPTGILAGAPGLVMSILCFTLMIRVCYLLSLLSLFCLIFYSRPALILAIRA